MRPYIINLTGNLIGKNRYDEVFHKIKNLNEFIKHVKFDLESSDIRIMNPDTLGRIMCSFEIGDVMASKIDLFSGVCFGGDCEDMFRELVSLCLAYVIRDRLDDNCQTGVPHWKRETAEPQTTKKWPPINPGTIVKTTQPNMEMRRQWTKEAWLSKKWGVLGKILRHHNSHGLCYDVIHEDGTESCYDPSEFEVFEKKL